MNQQPRFGLDEARPLGVTASGDSRYIAYQEVLDAGRTGLAIGLGPAVSVVLDNHGAHTFWCQFGAAGSSFGLVLDPHSVLPITAGVALDNLALIDLSIPGAAGIVPGGLAVPQFAPFPDEFVADSGGGFIVVTSADVPLDAQRIYRPLSTVLYNPASGSFEPQRTPTTFIPASITANPTYTAWTPTRGKRFRLMGLSAATGAASGTFYIQDGTAVFFILDCAGGGGMTNVVFPFNGYLSQAANNPLIFNYRNGASIAFDLNVYGTEE